MSSGRCGRRVGGCCGCGCDCWSFCWSCCYCPWGCLSCPCSFGGLWVALWRVGLRPKARVYVLVRIVCTSCVCMSVGESRVRVMDRNSGAWGSLCRKVERGRVCEVVKSATSQTSHFIHHVALIIYRFSEKRMLPFDCASGCCSSIIGKVNTA